MQRWYALHTKLYAEQKAATELRRHGIETYLPATSVKGGMAAERTRAYFPGYLFMNVDLNQTNASNWRWASGVRHIVSHGEVPVAIPAEVIIYMRRQLDELDVNNAEILGQRFRKGDQVRINDGPFADMTAVFEEDASASERVTILLEFLGRLSRVRIDPDSLGLVHTDENHLQRSEVKRRRRTRGRGRRLSYID